MPALPGKDHEIDMRRALTLLALCSVASRAHAFERDLTPEGVAPAFRAGPAWPRLVADLPAGGKRFLQDAVGYRATFVAGVETVRDGHLTGARPGRVVRLGHSAAS